MTVVTLRGVVGMMLMALSMAACGQSFRVAGRTLALCAAAGLAHALVAYGFIDSVAYIPVGMAVLMEAMPGRSRREWQAGSALPARAAA